ncbi:IDEAL domain-containing protein [Halalkalibacterium ligniniphilum]|uniref:IDEAL domain-containing protein n=1 Tax=Halalkalibacterium ligniniphilum TaxID=1134413 RepID=UPI0003496D3A|nr:IDEAL domain-containing protein [Halalkalibacterium ligniniphilum]
MNPYFARDKGALRQLQNLTNVGKRPDSIVQSLYAQAILEYAIFNHRRDRIEKAIDRALEEKKKEDFLFHTNELHQLYKEYRHGKVVSERGQQIHLTFY